jgi:hypothetical protein
MKMQTGGVRDLEFKSATEGVYDKLELGELEFYKLQAFSGRSMCSGCSETCGG